MKALLISFSILVLMPFKCYSQKMGTGIESKYDVNMLKQSNSIVWYGWDFSHVIFSDPRCTDGNRVRKELVPGWLSGLEQEHWGDDFMKKLLGKPNFKSDKYSIQPLMKDVKPDYLVDFYRRPLTIDSIANIVKAYPVNESGIGAVVIMEEMKKEGLSVDGYFTFFDISTKQLLYVCKVKGKADHKYGLIRFYRKGLANMLAVFKKYYKKLK